MRPGRRSKTFLTLVLSSSPGLVESVHLPLGWMAVEAKRQWNMRICLLIMVLQVRPESHAGMGQSSKLMVTIHGGESQLYFLASSLHTASSKCIGRECLSARREGARQRINGGHRMIAKGKMYGWICLVNAVLVIVLPPSFSKVDPSGFR